MFFLYIYIVCTCIWCWIYVMLDGCSNSFFVFLYSMRRSDFTLDQQFFKGVTAMLNCTLWVFALDTPWKINSGFTWKSPTVVEEETHLNQTSIFGVHLNFLGWTSKADPLNPWSKLVGHPNEKWFVRPAPKSKVQPGFEPFWTSM